jgi:hypothetical protein
MSVLQASIQLTLPASPFPPLAVGFMGLGTGHRRVGRSGGAFRQHRHGADAVRQRNGPNG